jgi:hypothetical protein
MSKIVRIAGMLFSVAFVAFLSGVLVAYLKLFPYPYIRDAYKTFRALIDTLQVSRQANTGDPIEAISVPAQASAERWQVIDHSVRRLPIIINGGLNQFLKVCPVHGCGAVVVNDQDSITEAVPYLPGDICRAGIVHGAYPHEMLAFDPNTNVYLVGIMSCTPTLLRPA